MSTDKEIAIAAIKELPEDVSLDEIVEEPGILAALRRGEQDADAGRIVRHQDVKSLFREWFSRYRL